MEQPLLRCSSNHISVAGTSTLATAAIETASLNNTTASGTLSVAEQQL